MVLLASNSDDDTNLMGICVLIASSAHETLRVSSVIDANGKDICEDRTGPHGS